MNEETMRKELAKALGWLGLGMLSITLLIGLYVVFGYNFLERAP